MAALSDLLAQDDVRLVTLTGPGGTGKTHLAQAVAAVVRGPLSRTASCFVDLSPLTEPHLVMPTIAAALGVRETRRGIVAGDCRPLSAGAPALAGARQLRAGAGEPRPTSPRCWRPARASPILATSREPLHIRAEREIAVAPLPLPDPGRLPPLS